MRKTAAWALVACAFVAIVAARRTPEPPKELMQTLTETVTVSGRSITVTTTRMDGEKLADWIARHNAAVAALRGGQ